MNFYDASIEQQTYFPLAEENSLSSDQNYPPQYPLQSQIDYLRLEIELLKKQNEEFKLQLHQQNEGFGMQILNLSSLLSGLSISSNSLSLQFNDHLQWTKKEVENARQSIEEISKLTTSIFKATIQNAIQEGNSKDK